MKCIAFLSTFFLLFTLSAFSQRQYSTYQKNGYVGLEFVETHTPLTLPEYEKITPLPNRTYTKKISSIYYGIDENKIKRGPIGNGSWVVANNQNIHYWKVVKNGKCGIINKEGTIIVPARYDNILGLIDSSFAIISHNGKTGVVQKNGTILIPSVYDKILYSETSDGHFILQAYSGDNFSLINENGKTLSTFSKTLDADIQENHVILTDKYSQLKGASTLSGQEILPLIYDELNLYSGIFSFKKDAAAGLMDLTGKRIFSRNCNRIFHVKDNRNIIDINYKSYQLIDNAGLALCADTFASVSIYNDFMFVKIKSTGKWGALNFDGKMIAPAVYQSLAVWNGMLVAKKDDKYGIINTAGNTLLPFKYQNAIISSADIPFLLVKQKGKYGCIDKQLQVVLPYKYQQLESVYYANDNDKSLEAVRIVSVKGTTKSILSGVIDLQGKVRISYEDKYFVGKKNEKYESNCPFSLRSDYFSCEKPIDPVDKMYDCIIIGKDMHELLRCHGRSIREYDDYFIVAFANRKYGMIAADGVTVIPFIYNQLYPLGNNHFVANKEGRPMGLLNRSGDTRIAFQYSGLRYFSDEYIIAQDTSINPKCGLVDYKGKIKIPFTYQLLSSDKFPKSTFLIAQKDSLYGIIDLNENIIIPFEYDAIQRLDTTLLHVQKNGKHGLIDSENKVIIPILYDELIYLNKNTIMVKRNGMYGLVNNENHMVAPIEYEEINAYYSLSYKTEDLFEVKKDGKTGSIDKNGNIILPTEFSSVTFDSDTYSRVCKDSMYYFAQASVVNYSNAYQEISRMGNMFRIKKNGKYGAANYKGDVIIEPVYDQLQFGFSEIIAENNGQKITFDNSGKMIVPLN